MYVVSTFDNIICIVLIVSKIHSLRLTFGDHVVTKQIWRKNENNHQKVGFHDHLTFCRCQNLEEAILFFETLDL